MSWHCTIRPTRFRFKLQQHFWLSAVEVDIPQCCCLQDGFKVLALEGRNLQAIAAASFETENGWQEFSEKELNEIRAIALEEVGCR